GGYMNHLRNILDGFSNVLTGFQPRPYSQSFGFKDDAKNLRNDVKTMGQDFTKSVNTIYGKATSDTSEKRQR
ncbi:MAG: hypothetical protein ACRC9V_09555, partial [Aeromonas sp.]